MCLAGKWRLGIALFILQLGVLSLFGQIPTAKGLSGNRPYEVAGTLTRVQTDGSFGGPLALNGFTASASAAVLPMVRVTGEFGSYSRNHVALKSFLAGPQVGIRIYRFQPFVRGLFGITHTTVTSTSQGNAFTAAGGGGLDFLITDQLALRVLQVDYYRPIGGPYRAADFLRFGFGVSYQFGTR